MAKDHLRPARRIVYRFFSLPHVRQVEVVRLLELATDDEIFKNNTIDGTLVFSRAKSQKKLAAMWDAIEERSEKKMSYANPFTEA